MNRKDFLKSITGGSRNIKQLCLWTTAFLVVLLFIKSDVSSFSFNTMTFLKGLGVIFFAFLLFIALFVVLFRISKIVLQIIPDSITGWLKTNANLFLNILHFGFIGFCCYYLLTRKEYILLAVLGVWQLISILSARTKNEPV